MIEKEVAEKLVGVAQILGRMLEQAFQAFRKPTEESVGEVEETVSEVRQSSSELTHFLIAKSPSDEKGKEWVKPYLSIASNFERVTYNVEGLIRQLRVMTKDQIFFSDRGVKEINDVFQEAMDFLESLPELILTQNKGLAQHIGEQVRSVMKIANAYAEEHEERLLRGICLPKSSPIYLGILESLKGVIVYTLEVGGTIASLAPKG
jgi:Na+/phosphate symporter